MTIHFETISVGLVLYDLELSPRLINTLSKAGITTINDLKNLTADELKSLPGIGRESFRDIVEVLSTLELSLRDEEIQP
jgi:DNA-directed RNA polymerase subunit alpha